MRKLHPTRAANMLGVMIMLAAAGAADAKMTKLGHQAGD